MWESKRNLLKTCLLSVLRTKTLKQIQTNQYQEAEKHYQKCIFWVFLSLLPTKKKAKIDKKLSILGNKETLREKCIMNVL